MNLSTINKYYFSLNPLVPEIPESYSSERQYNWISLIFSMYKIINIFDCRLKNC